MTLRSHARARASLRDASRQGAAARLTAGLLVAVAVSLGGWASRLPSARADRMPEPAPSPPIVSSPEGAALRAVVLSGNGRSRTVTVSTLEPGGTRLVPQRAKLDAYGAFALSPDGRLLAGVRGRRIVVRDLEARREVVVTPRPRRYELYEVRGFRPDGRALLYTHLPMDGMDSPPPGLTVESAAYLFSLDDRTTTRLPFADDFADFADSASALVVDEGEEGMRSLVRVPLGGGERAVIATSRSYADFGQLVVHGEEMTFLLGTHIARTRLDGRPLPDVTPEGAWAEYQWARYAPSGQAIVYQHRAPGPTSALELEWLDLRGGERRRVASCPSGCLADFVSDDRLLVLRGDALSILHLDGREIPVARGVRTFVVAGSAYR